MAHYFQMGSSLRTAGYTGQTSAVSVYSGFHKTVTQSVANTDTVEIPLVFIPRGVEAFRVNYNWDGIISATNGSAVLALRKVSNPISSNVQATKGVRDGAAPNWNLESAHGTDIAPTVTAIHSGSAIIDPRRFEGATLNPGARAVTQDDYYLSLLVTIGAAASFNANINIYASVEGKFLGNI
jgi:hypothetical protein